MKRIFLCIAVIFCVITGIFFSKKLPADTDKLIEKKYDRWAGVIRVWAAESCGTGGWLTAVAGIAEKQNEGVYINIQTVPDEAIAGLASSGVNPPDIIVYPAGLISGSSLLSPITASYPLRDGIRQSAYAAPVLVRSLFWIYDSGMARCRAICTMFPQPVRRRTP